MKKKGGSSKKAKIIIQDVVSKKVGKKIPGTKYDQFGPHLMIDAYNCDPEALNSAHDLYDFMVDLTKQLKMKMLISPYIIRAESNGKKDPGGWTGAVIIAESHISFHSFVKRKFITIDIYSCKDFDVQRAIKFVKKTFKSDDLDVFMQMRGLRYPAENLI